MNITPPSLALVPAHAEQWRIPPQENTLPKGLARFFLKPDYADLTIHCNQYKFRAHGVVLRIQTAWFYRAVSYNRHDSEHIYLEDVGDIDDAHIAVWGFLKYCYTGDIQFRGIIPEYQEPYEYLDQNISDPMLYYARIYFLADYFDAPDVSSHCLSRITAALGELRFVNTTVPAPDHFAEVDFPHLIHEVYSRLGHKETDQLREVLVQFLWRNWGQVERHPNLTAVWEGHSAFRRDYERLETKYNRLTGKFRSAFWEDSE